MIITNSDIGVIIDSILKCQEVDFPMEEILGYVDANIDETNPDGEGYEWLSDITPAKWPRRTKNAALNDFLKIINYVERLRALFFIA